MSKKIAGFHAVDETLKRLKGNRVGGTVLISGGNSKFDKKFNNIITTAENIGLKVQNVTMEELNNICSRKVHRGILLVLEEHENISRKKHDIKTFVQNIKTSKSIILLLDNIMDPGNLGAILRSADLFSVDAVVVPSKNSVKLTQTVQQSSSGASASPFVAGSASAGNFPFFFSSIAFNSSFVGIYFILYLLLNLSLINRRHLFVSR